MDTQRKATEAAPSTQCKGNTFSYFPKGSDAEKVVNRINEAVTKAMARQQSEKYSAGVLVGKTMNETLQEAKSKPIPDALFSTLWYRGENCCLFGDTGTGKSILAVQIGEKLADKEIVLYLDFELSDSQQLIRYSDGGNVHKFPDNFVRVSLTADDVVTEDALMQSVEDLVIKTGAKILIVDNLSYMVADAEKGSEAGAIMKRLKQLKEKHCLSALVIAHTPKVPDFTPLSINHLAGSKRLSNFFDSVFAVGRVIYDTSQRYIIQLKGRVGGYTHASNAVMLCRIGKVDACTRFFYRQDVQESSLISQREDRHDKRSTAIQLYQSGKSVADIAEELDVPQKTIYRWSSSIYKQKK